VNRTVLLHENFVEQLRVDFVDETKPLREQTVVPQVGALLRRTFNEHRAQLYFGARRNVELHQFMPSFFEI